MIRQTLNSLYAVIWIVRDAHPELMPAFDRRIVALRATLVGLDPVGGRTFLAADEMYRMQQVVLRQPSVVQTLATAQRRARFVVGLRQTAATRRKLFAFRLAVDNGTGPAASLSFELFVMVAEWVMQQ